jgi:hypothetical protein
MAEQRLGRARFGFASHALLALLTQFDEPAFVAALEQNQREQGAMQDRPPL